MPSTCPDCRRTFPYREQAGTCKRCVKIKAASDPMTGAELRAIMTWCRGCSYASEFLSLDSRSLCGLCSQKKQHAHKQRPHASDGSRRIPLSQSSAPSKTRQTSTTVLSNHASGSRTSAISAMVPRQTLSAQPQRSRAPLQFLITSTLENAQNTNLDYGFFFCNVKRSDSYTFAMDQLNKQMVQVLRETHWDSSIDVDDLMCRVRVSNTHLKEFESSVSCEGVFDWLASPGNDLTKPAKREEEQLKALSPSGQLTGIHLRTVWVPLNEAASARSGKRYRSENDGIIMPTSISVLPDSDDEP